MWRHPQSSELSRVRCGRCANEKSPPSYISLFVLQIHQFVCQPKSYPPALPQQNRLELNFAQKQQNHASPARRNQSSTIKIQLKAKSITWYQLPDMLLLSRDVMDGRFDFLALFTYVRTCIPVLLLYILRMNVIQV